MKTEKKKKTASTSKSTAKSDAKSKPAKAAAKPAAKSKAPKKAARKKRGGEVVETPAAEAETAKTTAKTTTSAEGQPAQATMGATPVVSAEELDPGRERRPLESYFQEIGGTRTLKREEEVVLAKDLEAAKGH